MYITLQVQAAIAAAARTNPQFEETLKLFSLFASINEKRNEPENLSQGLRSVVSEFTEKSPDFMNSLTLHTGKYGDFFFAPGWSGEDLVMRSSEATNATVLALTREVEGKALRFESLEARGFIITNGLSGRCVKIHNAFELIDSKLPVKTLHVMLNVFLANISQIFATDAKASSAAYGDKKISPAKFKVEEIVVMALLEAATKLHAQEKIKQGEV